MNSAPCGPLHRLAGFGWFSAPLLAALLSLSLDSQGRAPLDPGVLPLKALAERDAAKGDTGARARLLSLQGVVDAQAHVGAICLAGQGVLRDETRGMFWSPNVAESGQPEPVKILVAANAEGTAAKPEPPSFAKSRLAADGGDLVAQYTLALMYQRGEAGAPRDPIEAAKWMSRAAEKGYAAAQAQMGYYYANGLGVSRDEEEAVRWFKLAAKQGHPQAQSSLANFHSRGAGGLPRDLVEAARLYKLAADQGNPVGMAGYAWHLESGQGGVGRDVAAARALYGKAAAMGNEYARQQLLRLGE